MHNNPEKTTSFFEFWPSKLMYLPVAIQWLFLSIRHRSITLPLIANPKLTLSGMVGVGKSELMQQAQGLCQQAILPWNKHLTTTENSEQQATVWLNSIQQQGIELPFVCKPDIGCRGSGVKLIKNLDQLAQVIQSYPENTALLAQKLASYAPEAGIFYIKLPGETQGKVVSLTLKNSPCVIGDGEKTLQQLIELDPRAKNLTHLYQHRHRELWHTVLDKEQQLNLVFSASHCRGAVFTDAREHITVQLTASINAIMQDLPDFYYGRLDVKYSHLENLKQGKTLEIIEINGASAESIHIWDKNSTLREALKTLLWQYSSLFKLGAYQRSLGHKPPGLKKLYQHWRIEKNLAKYYPHTD